MERLETASTVAFRWGPRRRRAAQLRSRWPYADQMLHLYAALLDVQEPAFLAALEDRPVPAALAAYVGERVMADVVEATVAAGPPALAVAAPERLHAGGLEEAVGRWLAGEPVSPVERYLARAAASPVLEALGAAAAEARRGPPGEGDCPHCGGSAQLSFIPESSEALVTPSRRLLCSRCAGDWVHERVTCPACGERSTARLSIHAAEEQLPHLRAEACESCRRYLIAVDLRREPEAVPVVDELVALPLDLHMQERGFAKIVPNLMGT